MRRWMAALPVLAALVLGFAQPGAAGAKADPWRPTFESPANFYRIQQDWGTPAAGVVGPIYADVHAGLPRAADNANHARFAR